MWHECDPVVVGLVFKSDIDTLCDLYRDHFEVLAISGVDIWIGRDPDGVGGRVNDTLSTSFELLFRR